MEKKFNLIYVILSLLVVVVLAQSCIIYDFKDSFAVENKIYEKPTNVLSLSSNHLGNSDPFKEIKKMQEQMQKSFGQFNSIFANDPFFKDAFSHMGISPLSDLRDSGKEYIIEIDMPGVVEQNINIKTENKKISISANIDKRKDENNTNYIYKERFTRRFERSFILPNDADEDKIKTSYENGMLKVVIPKKS